MTEAKLDLIVPIYGLVAPPDPRLEWLRRHVDPCDPRELHGTCIIANGPRGWVR